MSTPAARICGPPIPKISIAARRFSAAARRAAYMSPLASPAESRREMGGMRQGSAQSLAGSGKGSGDPCCGGAAAEKAVEGIADLQLGFCVHARGGFVEDEEAGIVGEGAGEIDELALADGERGAALV